MGESLGDRIRMERARQRIKQKDLAARVGLSVSTLIRIEDGGDVWASVLKKLARELGVTTDYLVGEETEKQEEEPTALALAGERA